MKKEGRRKKEEKAPLIYDSSGLYDADYISAFYDDYGTTEWERLEKTPADRVNFFIHKHYLQKYVGAGANVLEAGAGPGRFTIELAKLCAKVTVGDISKKQLELNAHYVAEAGCEGAVEARVQLDITNLSQFETNRFDAVVCYGGALSYVMEQADKAVSELLRVVKPEGYVLLSVMSLVGATRIFLEGVMSLNNFVEQIESARQNGILTREDNNGHPMKLYRSKELRDLFECHGAEVVALSAANLISPGRDEVLEPFLNTPTWDKLLTWELDYCAEAGAVDCGTHILAVAQKGAP